MNSIRRKTHFLYPSDFDIRRLAMRFAFLAGIKRMSVRNAVLTDSESGKYA